ncbi:MAG: class I SAM-dependent methyltransferase [Bacillota bacterium]|nr:class I SAM-dependent methyltransferase [Bacillota bacterium]
MSSKPYFDQVAAEWDSLRQSFFSDAVREKALAVAGVRAGELAADIGAGSGFITGGLLARGLRVIAIDQSEAMLGEMRRKFTGAGDVQYRVGDAERLPLPEGAVDYAFANMCLHHVESPPAAIREMARILRPGGKLVLTDLDEHRFRFLVEEQHDRWMGFKRDDIRQWFSEAGLQNVAVDCVGENCCANSTCGCESASVSIFVASGEKP